MSDYLGLKGSPVKEGTMIKIVREEEHKRVYLLAPCTTLAMAHVGQQVVLALELIADEIQIL